MTCSIPGNGSVLKRMNSPRPAGGDALVVLGLCSGNCRWCY